MTKHLSHLRLYKMALKVGCPICGVRKGQSCVVVSPRWNPPSGRRTTPHTARIYAAPGRLKLDDRATGKMPRSSDRYLDSGATPKGEQAR